MQKQNNGIKMFLCDAPIAKTWICFSEIVAAVFHF